jgi:hypothetical protein
MTTSRTTRITLATIGPAFREPVADGEHPLDGYSSSPPSIGGFSDADAPVEPADKDDRLDNDQTKDGGSDKDANKFTNEDSSSIGGGSIFGPLATSPI